MALHKPSKYLLCSPHFFPFFPRLSRIVTNLSLEFSIFSKTWICPGFKIPSLPNSPESPLFPYFPQLRYISHPLSTPSPPQEKKTPFYQHNHFSLFLSFYYCHLFLFFQVHFAFTYYGNLFDTFHFLRPFNLKINFSISFYLTFKVT